MQIYRQFFEHQTPLVKIHFSQSRVADGAGVVHHGGEVESFTACGGDDFAGDGVELWVAFAGVREPGVEGVVGENLHG